jgi:hypothetical protein
VDREQTEGGRGSERDFTVGDVFANTGRHVKIGGPRMVEWEALGRRSNRDIGIQEAGKGALLLLPSKPELISRCITG